MDYLPVCRSSILPTLDVVAEKGKEVNHGDERCLEPGWETPRSSPP